MAKPEPWRLEARNYRFSMTVPTRYQDLDTLGHVNNVAMAAIFETARVYYHRKLAYHPRDMGVRWLVAAVDLKYLAEAHFAEALEVHSAVGGIGNSSWTLIQAAFQDGECVATCDTVMVMHGPRGNRVIDGAMRAILENDIPVPA